MLKIVALVDGKFLWCCDKCGLEFQKTKEQSRYLPKHSCKRIASSLIKSPSALAANS